MTRTQKQQHWQRHFRAWRSSGLSQAAYCEAHQLSLATFGYWRKRCSVAPSSSALPAVIPVLRETSREGVQLRSPAGWQILLPAGLDAESLCKLLSRFP